MRCTYTYVYLSCIEKFYKAINILIPFQSKILPPFFLVAIVAGLVIAFEPVATVIRY